LTPPTIWLSGHTGCSAKYCEPQRGREKSGQGGNQYAATAIHDSPEKSDWAIIGLPPRRHAASRRFTMIDFINSDAHHAANLPFSQAVRSGNMLFLSGCIGNVAGKMALVPGGIEAESRQMMENIGAVLKEAGSDFAQIVKCVVYLADMAEWPAFNKVYVPYFAAGRFPARTAIGVHRLILGARVEMECWAESG
jgi:reactive intermediate/imine deaminase